jgi:hypothetical protein
MSLQVIIALIFGVITLATAKRVDQSSLSTVCGFANRGDAWNESQHTYFVPGDCHALGAAIPVKRMYRDPGCDCSFYK